MPTLELKKDLFYAGTFNPSLRVFDIVMKTEYGTTYNSYIVKGKDKIALIECNHEKFFDEMCENIASSIGDTPIDYVVLNHTEPDHSGSLSALINKYPNITVLCSQAAAVYLKNIVNAPFNVHIVKDGETLDLGGKTLNFIMAPFLHWPDSMFTYCPEDKSVFTCDFLGCHFCEVRILAEHIKKPVAYKDSLEYYYGGIFGPFSPYVRAGLDKLSAIDFDIALPSHGPVLTGEYLKNAITSYRDWSKVTVREKKEVMVLYTSAYGGTAAVADCIAAGISEVFGDSISMTLSEITEENLPMLAGKINSCDALLLGSPTINRDAVPHIWNLLSHIDAINSKNITATAFGSYGWSGEAVPNILGRLKALKMKVADDGFKAILVPSTAELASAKQFGRDFAETL